MGKATSSTGTADNSIGCLSQMELRRQLRLLRHQQAPERVPNNNGQRLITETQPAAGVFPLPPFFLAAQKGAAATMAASHSRATTLRLKRPKVPIGFCTIKIEGIVCAQSCLPKSCCCRLVDSADLLLLRAGRRFLSKAGDDNKQRLHAGRARNAGLAVQPGDVGREPWLAGS